MDSYLALTVEIAERLPRNFEVGARSATESINELMPSHAPLGSLKRPNPGFVSCRAVVAPLVESAWQKLRGNKSGWIWNWNKGERNELTRL